MVVTQEGTVVGDIRARSVEVHGAVVGNVSGRREVRLRASGRLQGDVVTSSFELERGAYFNGHTKMLRPQDTSRRAESAGIREEQSGGRPAVDQPPSPSPQP